MAETPGDVGGIATGTAGSVCAISPSDTTAVLNNFMTRIEELEKAVTQLLATNIMANQLSDLSQQVGWVGNVTYMGLDGWTQTEYGTLIPPPGFSILGNGLTLSDGSTYNAVYYDENGVLQFGFQAGGTGVVGELPEAWNAAAAGTAADYAYASFIFGSGWVAESSRNISISKTVSGNNFEFDYTVSQSGLYLFAGNATDVDGTAGTIQELDAIIIAVNGVTKYTNSFQSPPNATRQWGGAVSGLIALAAGDVISMDDAGGGTIDTVTSASFSVVRISS